MLPPATLPAPLLASVTVTFALPSPKSYSLLSPFCEVLSIVITARLVPDKSVPLYTVLSWSLLDVRLEVVLEPVIVALTSGSTCTVKSALLNGELL